MEEGPATPPAPVSSPVPFVGDDGEPFDVVAFFDPDCGPPEGEDAWLAQVASPVADEYLARHQPPVGPQETLAAGFTHRDRESGARGWAAGGTLDIMEPGAALAGFADDAIADGLPALNDDQLIGLLCAARRLASRAASVELAAVADLNARREAHAARTRDRRTAEHVADEIAVALTLTCRAADKLLNLAAGVTRLPAVMDGLAAGQIDLPKANVYALELAGLADEPAAAIAALSIDDAAGLTTGELGSVLHRLVLAHDPDAARKKRKKAEQDARVETWPENTGTGAIAGRDLPPADVLAADKHIDYYARQLKRAGAPGTLQQLRATVFIALLTSRPLYTLLPGNDNEGGGGGGTDRNGSDGMSGGPAHGDGNDDRRPDRGDQARNRKDDSNPDEPNDGGGTCRPGPGTGPFGGRPGTGRGSGLPSGLTGSVNLTIPLSTWLGLTGQPGEAAGFGPLDADTSRDLAARIVAHPGSRWCLTILGPGDRAVGHGCASARAGPPPGGDDLPGDAATRWLAGLTISWLESSPCSHARETHAYQPSATLRHLIKTRQRTCTFSGCRRQARMCDDDHTLPFDQGGRTCECNLAPLCRRHHAAKQAPGWQLRQPEPGTLTWTMPSGRTRTVTPCPYPV